MSKMRGNLGNDKEFFHDAAKLGQFSFYIKDYIDNLIELKEYDDVIYKTSKYEVNF